MTMVVSRKQRIFFRYEGERGAFLILHHGLLGSHEDWFGAGYVQELAKEFRVVIPDARGHGRSDKPPEKEQYGQQQMAEDLIEIMNELGIRNSHILGYGLGALVGFELLRRYPERVRIAILGGESALMTPAVQDVHRAEAESLRAMGLADYVTALKDQGRMVRYAATVDEEAERPAALALMDAVSGWEPAPVERIQVASPLTLFAGADDPAAARVEVARSGVSRARLVHFPGLGHAALFQERTQLMEEVLRLLKSGRRDDEGRRGEQGVAGQSGQRQEDRRHGPPGRRANPRDGRWNDRRSQGSLPGAPREGAPVEAQQNPSPHEAPSPIPGAVLEARLKSESAVTEVGGPIPADEAALSQEANLDLEDAGGEFTDGDRRGSLSISQPDSEEAMLNGPAREFPHREDGDTLDSDTDPHAEPPREPSGTTDPVPAKPLPTPASADPHEE